AKRYSPKSIPPASSTRRRDVVCNFVYPIYQITHLPNSQLKHGLRIDHGYLATANRHLVHWVSIRVDFVYLTQVQLADTGFHLVHIPHHHPDEMIGLDEPFSQGVGVVRRDRQRFLSIGVEVVFWQVELQDGTVGAGQLLHRLK